MTDEFEAGHGSDEHLRRSSTRRGHKNGDAWFRHLLAEIGKVMLGAVVGGIIAFYGAMRATSHEMATMRTQLQVSSDLMDEFRYVLCNGLLPPGARAATKPCRGVQPDPELRRLMRERDTTP